MERFSPPFMLFSQSFTLLLYLIQTIYGFDPLIHSKTFFFFLSRARPTVGERKNCAGGAENIGRGIQNQQ